MTLVADALKFFAKFFSSLGLFPVQFNTKNHPEESKWLKSYSLASIVTFLFVFFYGFFESNSYYVQKGTRDSIACTVDYIQLIGIRFAHVVILLEAFVQRSTLIELLCKLNAWDEMVQKELNTINIDHSELRKKINVRLLRSGTLYFGVQLLLLCIILLQEEYQFIYYWSYYLVPFIACCFRYVQVYIVVFIINERFEILNTEIKEVDLCDVENGKEQRKSIKRGIDQLMTIRELYDNLWEICGLINKCFGLSMLINIGNDFIAITGHCYWIFVTVQHFPGGTNHALAVFGSIVWTIPAIINAFSIASICHKTAENANDTGFLVHQIHYNLENDLHNMALQQFSLQLLHQKVSFTGYGFFTIDFSLLFTMVSASTTYLVIIIQMHQDS